MSCSDCYDPMKRCPRTCPPSTRRNDGHNGPGYIPSLSFWVKLRGGKKQVFKNNGYRFSFLPKRYNCRSAKAEKGTYLELKAYLQTGTYYYNSPQACYGIKLRVRRI